LRIAIADARDARVVLAAKNLSPDVQRQVSTIENLLQTAQGGQDKNRPPLMSRVVSAIDSATAALISRPTQ
jgi:hypothetical protein